MAKDLNGWRKPAMRAMAAVLFLVLGGTGTMALGNYGRSVENAGSCRNERDARERIERKIEIIEADVKELLKRIPPPAAK